MSNPVQIRTNSTRWRRGRKKKRLCGRVRRRCPIFPWSCPHSIIGAEELNFRVRDGNGCALFAIITSSPAHTGVSLDTVYTTMDRKSCQYFFVRNLEIAKNCFPFWCLTRNDTPYNVGC